MTDEIRNPNAVDPVTPIDRLYSDWSDPVIPETETLEMREGTRVETRERNNGTILVVFNNMAKVILDMHISSEKDTRKAEALDIRRASWYYLSELTAIA